MSNDTHRVYGLRFANTDEDAEPYVSSNSTDQWCVVASLIPMLGIGIVLANVLFAFPLRRDNWNGSAERSWRAGIYGAILQIIVLTAIRVI